MKTAEDYRQHAAKCRRMSNGSISSEEKKMLIHMADIWESLAVEREAEAIARRKRISPLEPNAASFPIDRLNASNDDY